MMGWWKRVWNRHKSGDKHFVDRQAIFTDRILRALDLDTEAVEYIDLHIGIDQLVSVKIKRWASRKELCKICAALEDYPQGERVTLN